MRGSQNILDWACVSNNFIVSGNPTVSLSGEMRGNQTGFFSFLMDQSGQIIYGPRGGGGQQTCTLTLRTTTDTNMGDTARSSGTICGRAINMTVEL
jgi:hypothetical protein